MTLVGRDRDKLNRAASLLGGARIAVADIADRVAVEAVFAEIERVDHLVITAGSYAPGKLADTDLDVLLLTLQERIAGPMYAIKAALPRIPPTGSIMLTSGQLSDRPTDIGTSVISAALRGVEGLAQSLALELRPIRVNVIAPGLIDTPLLDSFGADVKSMVLDSAAAKSPVSRVGRPEEPAHGIVFLMENGFVNGEVLHVDGGMRFS